MRYSSTSAGQAQKARARLKKPLAVGGALQSMPLRRPRAVRLALLRAEGTRRILPLHRVPSLAIARFNEIWELFSA